MGVGTTALLYAISNPDNIFLDGLMVAECDHLLLVGDAGGALPPAPITREALPDLFGCV